jgi:hypothetical protein
VGGLRRITGWVCKIIGGGILAVGLIATSLAQCTQATDEFGREVSMTPVFIRGLVIAAIGALMFGVGRLLHGDSFIPD